jgi:hypothetical protein
MYTGCEASNSASTSRKYPNAILTQARANVRGGSDGLRHIAVAPCANTTILVEVALEPPQHRFGQALALFDNVAWGRLS